MPKQISLLSLVVLAIALVACSGGNAAATPTPGLTVKTAEPKPTETPPPTPTPVAAITPSAVGFSNPGTNGGEFPAPPANPKAEPKDTRGMARVIAPKLGINNYLEIVGVVNNEMQAPDDGTYAIGWFPEFGLPGAGGNPVITAHETWNHMQGPFYGLHKAALGDDVQVKMSDGRTLEYKVISNKRYQVDGMPMGDIIWPKIRPNNEEWLTLITCGGRIVYSGSGFGEYLDRDVVVARRVK
jgi:sortase (surface protein transpeptidase)